MHRCLALVCFAVCAAAQPPRPLEIAAVFGPGEVDQLAFSPDGRFLGALTSVGFRVYDTDTGRLRNSVVRPPSSSRGELSWSPDGKRFARASGDIEIWSPLGQTPDQVFPAAVGDSPLGDVAWSPQGNRLAARDERGIVLIDLASGRRARFPERSDEAQAFCWSPDGRELAVLALDQDAASEAIEIWETQQMALSRRRALPAPQGSNPANLPGAKLAWSPDGEVVAIGSGLTQRLSIWDARSLELVREYPATGEIQSLSWSRDRQLLYVGTETEVRFVNPTDGGAVHSVKPAVDSPKATMWTSAVSADGTQLAAFAGDVTRGEIELWRDRTQVPHARIPWNDDVSSAVLSPDGAQVALRLEGLGKWEIRDVGSGNRLTEVSGADGISWSPDGAILAARAVSQPVQFLRVRDGSAISSFKAAAFAWSPNADLVAEWHNDVRLLRVIGAEVEETIQAPAGHSYWVVSWSPNGRRILLEDSLSTPVVYSLEDKTLQPAPPGDGRLIWIGPEELARRAVSPDADFEQSPDLRYAVAAEGETWRLQDLRGESASVATLPNVGGSIVWSPDSKQVAYLTATQELHIWDVAAGGVVERWPAPPSLHPQDLVWGDRLILCEQLRGAIRIWRRPR